MGRTDLTSGKLISLNTHWHRLHGEKQRQKQNIFPHPVLFYFSFPPSFLTLLPSPFPEQCREKWEIRDSSRSMTAPLWWSSLLMLFYLAPEWILHILLLPSGETLLFGLSAGYSAFWGCPAVPAWSCMGCSMDICLGVVFCGLPAGNLLHHGLQRGSLLWQLEHLLLSFPLLSVSTMALSHFSLTPHCHAAVLCFIKCSFLELQPPWLRDTAWAPAANAPVYVGFNHLGLFISTSLEFIIFKTYVSYPVHLL